LNRLFAFDRPSALILRCVLLWLAKSACAHLPRNLCSPAVAPDRCNSLRIATPGPDARHREHHALRGRPIGGGFCMSPVWFCPPGVPHVRGEPGLVLAPEINAWGRAGARFVSAAW